ncbi:hypothetical protein TRVL_02613 [Trypanosoma vivax]|uniref:Uncharacterized protein n=1 Tax=Trypanosoma vivax (strain Y486) TaxID=1055687 RepID=G0TV77_TRYVY|nr:hypothetical protein TRVL_02613 [Trypanosoma vivax]CCC47843.1 hypothetical protein, unlikely [Trypanosoma vivax Y486]
MLPQLKDATARVQMFGKSSDFFKNIPCRHPTPERRRHRSQTVRSIVARKQTQASSSVGHQLPLHLEKPFRKNPNRQQWGGPLAKPTEFATAHRPLTTIKYTLAVAGGHGSSAAKCTFRVPWLNGVQSPTLRLLL